MHGGAEDGLELPMIVDVVESEVRIRVLRGVQVDAPVDGHPVQVASSNKQRVTIIVHQAPCEDASTVTHNDLSHGVKELQIYGHIPKDHRVARPVAVYVVLRLAHVDLAPVRAQIQRVQHALAQAICVQGHPAR